MGTVLRSKVPMKLCQQPASKLEVTMHFRVGEGEREGQEEGGGREGEERGEG